MGIKTKKIIVRITENQARWLADYVLQEEINKSQIVRNAINLYLVENFKGNEYTESKNKHHRKDE
jgi:hypothetical protein